MMKRARPRQHTRVVKTKTGRKRITVNKGVKGKKKSSRYQTSKGTFKKMTDPSGRSTKKSKFYGCERAMQHKGNSAKAAKGICGAIAARKHKARNYGFMFKSTNWDKLAEASRKQKSQLDFKADPYSNSREIVPARLEPYETLAFIDLDKGFNEMRSKGVRVSPEQEKLVKRFADDGEYFKAHEALPREGKMFANLALNAESIAEQQRSKSRSAPKTIQPKRSSKRGSLPTLNKSNSMTFAELDQWLAEQKKMQGKS